MQRDDDGPRHFVFPVREGLGLDLHVERVMVELDGVRYVHARLVGPIDGVSPAAGAVWVSLRHLKVLDVRPPEVASGIAAAHG